MTAHGSAPDLLLLHAVRLAGYAQTAVVAARFDLDPARAEEELLDAEAYGWVRRDGFPDLTGWSLTEAGRRRNETQLSDELERTGSRSTVDDVHRTFPALNHRATELFTTWQLAPPATGPDAATLGALGSLADALATIEDRLTARLTRFAGYHDRFRRAVARLPTDAAWLTGIDVDSCHRVWFELHEDLIATLGLTR